ncbi:hypothetical protein CC1G_13932 [Coprinopsis cinerea okayama7|uniref:Uncharacterized protein n=1 Tax=Coprinopsis cinerea (strain Okayama-7 / 130 / ATCC MYA-4618 / FGSC 9003) TaxID=240176 RepID=D6RKP0_COPC7|nr:hypothetical protein CC1G_13932 [Coprinopsis cinerea okayama7\|eukprot:XP_002911892.1 hypothetical protein CC1G_13932 [Coprinopsis cinerea okayama7\
MQYQGEQSPALQVQFWNLNRSDGSLSRLGLRWRVLALAYPSLCRDSSTEITWIRYHSPVNHHRAKRLHKLPVLGFRQEQNAEEAYATHWILKRGMVLSNSNA